MSPVLRTGSVYAALFVVFGINLPFLPVWLKAIGLSNEQLALALASQSAIRVFSAPILTYLADRWQAKRSFVIGLAAISTILTWGLTCVSDFPSITALLVLSGAAMSPILPMLDTLAFEQAEEGHYQYGHVRICGSLAFVVGSLAAGTLLLVIDEQRLIWPLIVSNAFLAGAGFWLQKSSGEHDRKATPRYTVKATARVLLRRAFLVFLLAAGLTQASHAMLYSFGSVHWASCGYSGTTIGILWGLGIVAEITLFHWGRVAVSRWGAERLLMIGGALAVVRWGAMAFTPPLVIVGMLQTLHAASFGATHLGTIYYIHRRFSSGLGATAQGLYSAVAGGVFMTGMLSLCGGLYERFGGVSFAFMSLISLLGFVCALLLPMVERKTLSVLEPTPPPPLASAETIVQEPAPAAFPLVAGENLTGQPQEAGVR
jgi:MFS transporter, PPP family, 3-phenylpropionic acid transporter